jgi:hypothetical protein
VGIGEKQMNNVQLFYDAFVKANSQEEMQPLAAQIQKEGYALINSWILHIKKQMKKAVENEFSLMRDLLHKAEGLLPEPELVSPLWEGLWGNLHKLFDLKEDIFRKIAAEEQIGEWQLLFDNPYTTDNMVVHVQLTFAEAAYMYAEYRLNLKKFENITLQRVQRFLSDSGDARPEIEEE